MNEELEELDLNWVEEYEKDEKIYNHFNCEDTNEIKLVVFYLNNNEIANTIKDKILLSTKNLIKQEELLYQIKKYNKNTKLSYISLYNINIQNVKEINNIDKENYLQEIKGINDIKLAPTLKCFINLNTLYIFLTEKNKEQVVVNTTKRIIYKPTVKKTKHNRKELKKTL